jgi:hypothetical protein
LSLTILKFQHFLNKFLIQLSQINSFLKFCITKKLNIIEMWTWIFVSVYSFMPCVAHHNSEFTSRTECKKKRNIGSHVKKSSLVQQKRQRALNRMRITISLLFIFLTLPKSFVSIFYNRLILTANIIIYSIIVLTITNRKLFTKLKILLWIQKKTKQQLF